MCSISQALFDGLIGAGKARVILPITDPYVAHHGALGSFATVYVPPGTNVADLTGKLRATPGIERVLSREEACAGSNCRPIASATSSSSPPATRYSAPPRPSTICRV